MGRYTNLVIFSKISTTNGSEDCVDSFGECAVAINHLGIWEVAFEVTIALLQAKVADGEGGIQTWKGDIMILLNESF